MIEETSRRVAHRIDRLELVVHRREARKDLGEVLAWKDVYKRQALLVAPPINFAARLLREKHGLPLISLLIYPFAFISAHEICGGVLCASLLRRLPLFVRKIILSSVMPYAVSYTHLDVYKRQAMYYCCHLVPRAASFHSSGWAGSSCETGTV